MLALVFALIAAIHPLAPKTGQAHAFAHAIAYVVEHDPAPEGVTRELAAALLVTYGWGESRFSMGVKRGDNGIAACAYQVHADTEERRQQLERDPIACTRAAYAILRASYKACGGGAGYCGSCHGAAAKAIADARARQAQGILDKAVMRLVGGVEAP